jgi:transaldolase/glucose-6-phosphate isomerase
VAIFFVSRIDTAVDALLENKIAAAPQTARAELQALKGRVAIANAKLAYQHYLGLIASDRWKKLSTRGARPQRLLWASTSSKNPAYRDVIYVEELVGRDTVNTVPPATLDAFLDHGVARPSLEEDAAAAKRVLDTLQQQGVSLDAVTDVLLKDGVALFAEAFDKLLAAVRSQAARTA